MFRKLFHACLRLFVYIFIGTNIYGKENLPEQGPAVIVANHNSHLDALVILSLFRCKGIGRVRVAAAADYFFRGKLSGMLFSGLLGLIPVSRGARHPAAGVLDGIYKALDGGGVVVVFPEGTRGNPGELSPLKNGISKIAERYPAAPVVPVLLKGTEKALPKGKKSFVPLIINVTVCPGMYYGGSRAAFMDRLNRVFAEACQTAH